MLVGFTDDWALRQRELHAATSSTQWRG